RSGGKLGQDFEPDARPCVVEMDEGVVENERERAPLLQVSLEARDPQREVELVPRPLAQTIDGDGSSPGAHALEHAIVGADAQPLEAQKAQARKDVRGAAQDRTLMALPVTCDLPLEDAARESKSRVPSRGFADLGRGLGQALRRVRRAARSELLETRLALLHSALGGVERLLVGFELVLNLRLARPDDVGVDSFR